MCHTCGDKIPDEVNKHDCWLMKKWGEQETFNEDYRPSLDMGGAPEDQALPEHMRNVDISSI